MTFAIIQENVSAIATASESEIISAMKFVWERMKLIIEPSAAVPLAVLLNNKIKIEGKKIGVIFSGGNVDLAHALTMLTTGSY
jgi:threonine dehydratase